jgi:hypothetical protein
MAYDSQIEEIRYEITNLEKFDVIDAFGILSKGNSFGLSREDFQEFLK